ncbi:PIN domain-containing protein [Candidatus Desantisbacteria bacterium]|nr:PIN domain-containing protein [Candidatus Desantisbacteria bacterium]
MYKKVFLDTSYAIALSNLKDQYHPKAEIIAKQIEFKNIQLITTHAVIIEIANTLAKLCYRKASIELINSLEEDTNVEIIPVSEHLYKRAPSLQLRRFWTMLAHTHAQLWNASQVSNNLGVSAPTIIF